MLAALKQKLEEKKARNKAFERAQWWKKNVLLQDCLQAMRGSCTMVNPELHEAVVTVVNIALSEDNWTTVEELSDIPEDFLGEMVYIVWNEATLPLLKAPWKVVEENLYDVRCVDFETFLVAETMDRIIDSDNWGKIRLYDVR